MITFHPRLRLCACGNEFMQNSGAHQRCQECAAAKRKRLAARPEAIKKKQAQLSAAKARRDGKLVPQPCQHIRSNGQRCGDLKVHGHHEDYSKPLDVIWLCAMHHAWLHGDRRVQMRLKDPDLAELLKEAAE